MGWPSVWLWSAGATLRKASMRILVGGVSSLSQYVDSVRSFFEIQLRVGDERMLEYKARGDKNRIKICNAFLNGNWDALYLVDIDMLFCPLVLEQLREHDVPIVTGHYFKRKWPPESIISLGSGTLKPMEIIPEGENLYNRIDGEPIASTGFGNVLIQREVIEKVADIVPFPFAIGPMPEMASGELEYWGADYHFFDLARRLGYEICLDVSEMAEAKHAVPVWLDRELYNKFRRAK